MAVQTQGRQDKQGQGAALITGATGGLGREFVAQLARAGCKSFVLTGRSKDALEQLAQDELVAKGCDYACIACDLSQPGAPKALFDQVEALGIQIDMLVNNAGFALGGPFIERDAAAQRSLVDVNVGALTELCCLFGQGMACRGYGRILNVASVAGFMPGPDLASYYASKAYVLSLSRSLHRELAGKGVVVTALCPGPVATPFWERASAGNTLLAHIAVPARRVVASGLFALRIHKTVCVPGIMWKLVIFFVRFIPPSWAAAIAGGLNKEK